LRGRWKKKPPGKRENWGSCGWEVGAGEEEREREREREKKGEVGVGGSPWKPDWTGLVASVRRRRRGEKVVGGGIEASEEEMVVNEGNASTSNSTPSTSTSTLPTPTPWLLRLPFLSTTLLPSLLTTSTPTSASTSPAETLLSEINAHRSKRNLVALPSDQAEDLFDGALVRVTVKICGRGVASEVGPIYLLEEDGREDERRWREGYGGGRKGRDVDHDEEVSFVRRITFSLSLSMFAGGLQIPEEGLGTPKEKSSLTGRVRFVSFRFLLNQAETVLPPSSSMIGFHTSGAFSLARGKGHGIGTIPLFILLELMRKDLDAGRSKIVRGGLIGAGGRGELLNLVKVRGRESRVCRAATLEVLD